VELRQLAYFDAVVRHGSFTKAAQRLHVAQPAVSAQIRRLEAELGVTLLERTTRRVALTQAGELFLARARLALAQLEGARADLAELSAVLRGQVRIGATQVLGSLDLPAALAQFRRRYPGVSLALHSGLIAKLLGLLEAGDVDLVVGPVHDDLPAAFAARPLVAEGLVLVTPPGTGWPRSGARRSRPPAPSRSSAWPPTAGCTRSLPARPRPRALSRASSSRPTARPASASLSPPDLGWRCSPGRRPRGRARRSASASLPGRRSTPRSACSAPAPGRCPRPRGPSGIIWPRPLAGFG